MRPPLRFTLGSILLLAASCASPPLGEDWGDLDPAGRDARAVEVARGIFTDGVDGLGRPVAALDVVSADAGGIRWRTSSGESALRWLDVASVDDQVLAELPGRPESLYVVVAADAPSARTVRELTSPTLAHIGVGGPTLTLPQRPARARERLVAALDHLRRSGIARLAARAAARPASTSPVPSASTAAVASPAGGRDARLDALEEELRRLQRWRDEGLITEAEHAAAKRAVLDRLASGQR